MVICHMIKIEWGKFMNQKTNDMIVRYVKNRLDLGNAKFGRQMPLGKYTIEDILEENIDSMIYTISLLLKAKEINDEK